MSDSSFEKEIAKISAIQQTSIVYLLADTDIYSKFTWVGLLGVQKVEIQLTNRDCWAGDEISQILELYFFITKYYIGKQDYR